MFPTISRSTLTGVLAFLAGMALVAVLHFAVLTPAIERTRPYHSYGASTGRGDYGTQHSASKPATCFDHNWSNDGAAKC